MPRRPQKRTAERPAQQPQSLIVIDPLVGPGNPPHRHPPCPKTDQSRQHHCMVSLATCASSRRSESAHQTKYATVMLEVANRMALRFLGERGPEYLTPTYDRPRYLIKIIPTKMTTWDGVEWARKYT